jgi:hypothetical protein
MNSVSDSGEHQSLEVLFLRSAVAAADLADQSFPT